MLQELMELLVPGSGKTSQAASQIEDQARKQAESHRQQAETQLVDSLNALRESIERMGGQFQSSAFPTLGAGTTPLPGSMSLVQSGYGDFGQSLKEFLDMTGADGQRMKVTPAASGAGYGRQEPLSQFAMKKGFARDGGEQNSAEIFEGANRSMSTRGKVWGMLEKGLNLGGLAVAAVSATKAIVNWVKGLSESNRELSKFSGELAGSFAALDVQEIEQQFRMAQNTSASGAALNRSIMDLNEQLFPIREELTRFGNQFGTLVSETGQFGFKNDLFFATVLLKEINKVVAEILKTMGIEIDKRNMKDDTPIQEWAQGIASRQANDRQPRQPLPPLKGN